MIACMHMHADPTGSHEGQQHPLSCTHGADRSGPCRLPALAAAVPPAPEAHPGRGSHKGSTTVAPSPAMLLPASHMAPPGRALHAYPLLLWCVRNSAHLHHPRGM